MNNFIDINSDSQKYSIPTPFQQFRGNYASLLPTTTGTGGMFASVTVPTTGTTRIPGECRQLCASNINCEMWTYDSSRRCNLYNSTDVNTVSGIRIDTRLRTSPVTPFSIHSNTIPAKVAFASSSAPSLQACEDRCNVTASCALYTYSLTGPGTCSMYTFGTGTAGGGNVGSSSDLMISTPQILFTSNPFFTVGTKNYNFTYSNSFAPLTTVRYSVFDKNNPSQLVYGPLTIPGTWALGGVTVTNLALSGAPSLGNVYVSNASTNNGTGPNYFSAPVNFYANAAASLTNFTTDYTLSDGTKYRCHVFNASGTLVVSGTGIIDYFVVGGGGGGAGGSATSGGAGGGGGQVRSGTVNLKSTGIGSLAISVGGGGAGVGVNVNGNPGTNSRIAAGTNTASADFTTVEARGGAGGKVSTSSTALGTGGTSNVFISGTATTATNLGFRSVSGGSGGGGAGTGGASPGVWGGAGFSSNFRSGISLTGYGGGGGGGAGTTGSQGGGPDGAGRGALNTETTVNSLSKGKDNTGGGGGGGRGGSTQTGGAAGGSGIVMIRYIVKT
jgi:hypothetical protein